MGTIVTLPGLPAGIVAILYKQDIFHPPENAGMPGVWRLQSFLLKKQSLTGGAGATVALGCKPDGDLQANPEKQMVLK